MNRIAALDAFITPDMPLPAPSTRQGEDTPYPGLVAVGLDLSAARLREAYAAGLFPWFSPGEPVLWWSPEPRMVLRPAELHVHRSLRQSARRAQRAGLRLSVSENFAAVMQACGSARPGGSWIHAPMLKAYGDLHAQGMAQSFELRQAAAAPDKTGQGQEHQYEHEPEHGQGHLLAGLYGVNLGSMFFGESMFTRITDGSKLLLLLLCRACLRLGLDLIDCQQQTRHLASLGAQPMPVRQFEALLRTRVTQPTPTRQQWRDAATAAWQELFDANSRDHSSTTAPDSATSPTAPTAPVPHASTQRDHSATLSQPIPVLP